MPDRLDNWFTEMFGRAADAIGDGIADVRDKVVFDGFFDLHTPERNSSSEPGELPGHSAAADQTPEAMTALEQFYNRLSPAERAEHFRDPVDAREPDRGIDL